MSDSNISTPDDTSTKVQGTDLQPAKPSASFQVTPAPARPAPAAQLNFVPPARVANLFDVTDVVQQLVGLKATISALNYDDTVTVFAFDPRQNAVPADDIKALLICAIQACGRPGETSTSDYAKFMNASFRLCSQAARPTPNPPVPVALFKLYGATGEPKVYCNALPANLSLV